MNLSANSEICNDLLEKLAYRTWKQIAQAGAKAYTRGTGMGDIAGFTRNALTRVTPKDARLLNYTERRGDQLARASNNRLSRMLASDNEWQNEAVIRHGGVVDDANFKQILRNRTAFRDSLNNENAPEIVGKLRNKFPYVK